MRGALARLARRTAAATLAPRIPPPPGCDALTAPLPSVAPSLLNRFASSKKRFESTPARDDRDPSTAREKKNEAPLAKGERAEYDGAITRTHAFADVQSGATVSVRAPTTRAKTYPCRVAVDPWGQDDDWTRVEITTSWLGPEGSTAPSIEVSRPDEKAIEVVVRAKEKDGETIRGEGHVTVVHAKIPPRYCGVSVASGGGEVFVRSVVEPAEPVDIDSGGGHVRLGEIRGAKLNVDTGGGELRAQKLTCEGRVATDGGDVVVGKFVGSLKARTTGGRVNLETLFAQDVDVETSGGDFIVGNASQWHARGSVRTEGGDVKLGGVGGNGEETLTLDTGGGKCELELHERLHRVHARTDGGDVALTVPEGFAPRVVVFGTYDGNEEHAGEVDLSAATNAGGEARSIHWSPYDRVGVVNADP